jgi:hypothetical protein
MGQQRKRIKHTKTFEERLMEEARTFKQAASQLPLGKARELLLRRATQAETALRVTVALRPRLPQPPK